MMTRVSSPNATMAPAICSKPTSVWRNSCGRNATSPIGRRAATVLFPLEMSIPTAFILLLLLIGYGFPPFTHRLFNLLGDANAPQIGGTTCANRMLRMREAADGLIYGSLGPR